MSFQHPQEPSALRNEMANWLARNRTWSTRPILPIDDDQFALFWTQSYRVATVDEVAADILDSPALREALSFLASPPGQTIEHTMAQLWVSGWEADLLTAALTQAWKIVLNENRPIWQRTEVLVGASLLVGLVIWVGRSAA